MDFKKLKNKDMLKINNKIYEVLNSSFDVEITNKGFMNLKRSKVDKYKLKKEDYINILVIQLHNFKSKSLFPTNSLKVYPNNKKIIFFDKKENKFKLNLGDIQILKWN